MNSGQRAVAGHAGYRRCFRNCPEARGPVSIATIRDALGDRSFAALLFFFAVINLIPLPPGTSALSACRC